MQPGAALKGREFDVSTEDGIIGRNFEFVDQILSLHLVVGVFLKFNSKVKISRLASPLPFRTLPGQTNTLPLPDTARDLYGISLDFPGIASSKGNLAGRAMKGFLQRNEQIGLDILAARRAFVKIVATGEATGKPTTSSPNICSKKSLKPVPPKWKSAPPASPPRPYACCHV